MTHLILLIDACLCAGLAARLIAYRKRDGAHRPMVAGLAWLMAVAAVAVTVGILLGSPTIACAGGTVLHATLLLAILAARGNVADLLYARTAGTRSGGTLYRLIRGDDHATG